MNHVSRGDISIYIALTTAILMLGSATLLSLLLARQISLTKNLVASERAFFAANAGQEQAYYLLALDPNDVDVPEVTGQDTITYDGAQPAGYNWKMKLVGGNACGKTEGVYPELIGTVRRLYIGAPGC